MAQPISEMMASPRDRGAPSDEEAVLIARCRAGDRAAVEMVLRREAPHLSRLLTRLVGPGPDVDDLLQQTLIGVVRSLPRFRGQASLRTWSQRIAVNMARQHFRRPRRTVSLELVPEALEDGVPPAGPALVASRRALLTRVFEHLGRIGADKRIALVLHVFEGRDLDEVAALMGASRAATKSRVFWARRALLARARKDPLLAEYLRQLEGAR